MTKGKPLVAAPRESALGSIVMYITHADPKNFQPANITFDLLPALDDNIRFRVREKRVRHRIQCERALGAFNDWWPQADVPDKVQSGITFVNLKAQTGT